MSLFSKTKTIYTSASIADDMLVLTRQTRFKASHSESRIMIDKVSSVTLAVIFGPKSWLLVMFGLLFAAIGIILAAGPGQMWGLALTAMGILLIVLAFIFKEHSIDIDCGGDWHQISVGRKGTDEFYQKVCKVLKIYAEGKHIADTALTAEND